MGKLEIRRTHFANERTFLAYVRTALTFFLLGTFVIKFLDLAYFYIAVFSFLLGLGVLFYGGGKFMENRKRIENR